MKKQIILFFIVITLVSCKTQAMEHTKKYKTIDLALNLKHPRTAQKQQSLNAFMQEIINDKSPAYDALKNAYLEHIKTQRKMLTYIDNK